MMPARSGGKIAPGLTSLTLSILLCAGLSPAFSSAGEDDLLPLKRELARFAIPGDTVLWLTVEPGAAPPQLVGMRLDGQALSPFRYRPADQAALTAGVADPVWKGFLGPGDHRLEIRVDREGGSVLSQADVSAGLYRIALRTDGVAFERVPPGQATGWRIAEARWHLGRDRPLEALNALDRLSEADAVALSGHAWLAWGAPEAAKPLLDRAGQPVPALRATFDLQQYSEVVSRFRALLPAVRGVPRDEAQYLAGTSLLRLGQTAPGHELLTSIPRSSPFYPFALHERALAFRAGGDAYTAIGSWRRLESFHARDPVEQRLVERARSALGHQYLDQRRDREALDLLRRVPEDSSYFASALSGIAWAYFGLGEYAKTIVAFRDLASRYPDRIGAYEGLLAAGEAYRRLQAYDPAAEQYRRALIAIRARRNDLDRLLVRLKAGDPTALDLRAGDPVNEARDRAREARELRDAARDRGLLELAVRAEVIRKGREEEALRVALQETQAEARRLEELAVEAAIQTAAILSVAGDDAR